MCCPRVWQVVLHSKVGALRNNDVRAGVVGVARPKLGPITEPHTRVHAHREALNRDDVHDG